MELSKQEKQEVVNFMEEQKETILEFFKMVESGLCDVYCKRIAKFVVKELKHN